MTASEMFEAFWDSTSGRLLELLGVNKNHAAIAFHSGACATLENLKGGQYAFGRRAGEGGRANGESGTAAADH